MALFVILALSPNGATRIYLWPWSLLTSLLILIPIVVTLALPLKGRPAIDLNVTLALGLLGALLVLSAVTSSHPARSLEACLIPIGAIFLVFLVARTMNEDRTEFPQRQIRLQQSIGAFGVAFGFVSLTGWIGGTLLPQWSHTAALNDLVGSDSFVFRPFQFRNEFPLGHANYTAGLALILLPWLAGLAIHQRGRRRWMWTSAALLIAFVLFTAGSRGALLGIGAMAGTALLVRGFQRGIRGPRMMIGLAAIVMATGLFALATPRVRSLVTDLATSRTLNSGDVQRWEHDKAGLRMGWDAPLLGQGPGLTPLITPSTGAPWTERLETALQLHSTPIPSWADLGLAGCLVCLLLLGLILSHGFRLLGRKGEDQPPSPNPILASAVVSTVGYLAFSVTDYQLDIPIFAGLLAVNLGVISRPPDPETTPARHRPIFPNPRSASISSGSWGSFSSFRFSGRPPNHTWPEPHSRRRSPVSNGTIFRASFEGCPQLKATVAEMNSTRSPPVRACCACLCRGGSESKSRTREPGDRRFPQIPGDFRFPGDRPFQPWLAAA